MGNRELITEQEVIKAAVEKFGVKNQVSMAQEECAELIQAISKYLRYGTERSIIEEAIDVEIMLRQLKIMFPSDLWVIIKQEKLRKLRALIEK